MKKIHLESLIKESLMKESSLSRIWQHVENDKTFAAISAYRNGYSAEQNELRHTSMKALLKELKLGFIEMNGGYEETNEDGTKITVSEKSLLIPNISAKQAIDIGVIYNQDSIIFKKEAEMYEVSTNERKGRIGRALSNFSAQSGKGNLDMSTETLSFVFSSLTKGSHKDRKFAYSYKGDAEEDKDIS